MNAIKELGIFALALTMLTGMLPIAANAADEAPAITLSSYSNIFKESATGPTAGRIDVKLTVPPSGLAVGESITVVLDVQRNGYNDGILPVLSTYEIPFMNGQTTGSFYLSELDGTPQSALKGFRINASIKETTPCAIDPTKTWRTYYAPENDFDIFVENVPPVIGPGSAPSTNEVPAAIGVPFTITWNVKDVASDQQYMIVAWTYNGSSMLMNQTTTGTYSKEIVFWSPGSKVVTLRVQDKDGGIDTRSWYYQVPRGEGEEKNGYTWFYTVANGEAAIDNYGEIAVSPDPVGQLKIPSELGGYPVGKIASSAFSACSGLTSVVIPSSVTTIGDRAFQGCSALTSVAIPSSVTSIGNYAFDGCSALMSFVVDADNPTYCSLNGLLCSKDGKEVILGVNGDVTIPAGVTSFNDRAFSGCSGLTSVTIPSSVTWISSQAFVNCSALTSFVVDADNPNYCSLNGLLCSKDGKRVIVGVNGDVTIPSGVMSFEGYAFNGFSGLTSVTIPSSVTRIYGSAFRGCSGLMSFVVDVDNPTYCSLNGLLCSKDDKSVIVGVNGDVTIPSGVESIGAWDSPFKSFSGLTSVTIPSSVTRIGSSAFEGCTGLMSFVVDADNPTYCSLNGLLCSKNGKEVILGVNGDVTIPAGVTRIGSSAFRGCSGLTSVVIPSSVTFIGSSAFEGCDRLSRVYVEGGDAARVRALLEMSALNLNFNSISFVEDWVRVDETVMLPLAVIEEGMAKYPALAALAGGDVEAFAKLPSAAGKLDRSGRQMQVWQDLVAGTDPTDPDDQFKVTAIAMENGTIKVTWSPDLNENGTKNVRRYIQYGSKTIGEAAAWVDLSTVPAAEQNDYKFRKVTVGMP
ncbi:MAG: leucine-rich repeat domain-containing protein [Kiritimatiellae bacterium]|nr:leucine-rich repeat domain-containing protein [Kiritimatiellia bacterium]